MGLPNVSISKTWAKTGDNMTFRDGVREAATAVVEAPEARVLVVDDDEFLRNMVCEMLREDGYKTISASDGVEALTVLKANCDVDMVITDINMPSTTLADFVRRGIPKSVFL